MSSVIVFAVRMLLVLLFLPFSALDKILNFRGAVGQAREIAPGFWATGLILAGMAVEIFGSLGVLTGITDRLAAFVLAGYCGVTALLWKQFWKPGDFWQGGGSKGRQLFWDFLKNFALAGGFLDHLWVDRDLGGRVPDRPARLDPPVRDAGRAVGGAPRALPRTLSFRPIGAEVGGCV